MMKEEQLGTFAQMSSMAHKPFFCVAVLNSIETEDRTLVSFLDHLLSVVCKFYTFLGHLSHSGDLMLWVGVRRSSCVVR